MDTLAASSPALGFVGWEKVFLYGDGGRKKVHYYLKRRDGSSDLAVVGRKRSSKHMAYDYDIRNPSLLSISPSSAVTKLRSLGEVVDWLNSIVSDSAPDLAMGSPVAEDAGDLDIQTLQNIQLRKLGHDTKEFMWLGSAWTCRKKRRHYQSFQRNGVKISVSDFVYVLAEKDKRLVAYLEDMYEDSKSNKMVVVRWFHKTDEVGIILKPHNFSDREIFFSLCLQHLSIECIDGLATVLSPYHFQKFLDDSKLTQFEAFVCYRQFNNEDIESFDITQIKGYWKQDVLRYLRIASSLMDKHFEKPRKRICTNNVIDKNGMISEVMVKEMPLQHLAVGSEVEILSQDSGVRGCWYRAVIIKKYKDKVKVCYQDVKDADNEANNLEEWVLASRVAMADEMGVRISGRRTIRPGQVCSKSRVSWAVDVGAIVDVWWHDGWWEGIVIRNETENRFHVYFPGEKRVSIFPRSDIRHSDEWVGNKWECMKERPDLATSLVSSLTTKQDEGKSVVDSPDQNEPLVEVIGDSISSKDEMGRRESPSDHTEKVPDLLKNGRIAQLKWSSSRKRQHGNGNYQKGHKNDNNNDIKCKRISKVVRLFSKSLKVDHENWNWKYMGDSLFSSSVPPLTSLVMTR